MTGYGRTRRASADRSIFPVRYETGWLHFAMENPHPRQLWRSFAKVHALSFPFKVVVCLLSVMSRIIP